MKNWITIVVVVTAQDRYNADAYWGQDAINRALARVQKPEGVRVWLETHPDDDWFDRKCRIRIAAVLDGKQYITSERCESGGWLAYDYSKYAWHPDMRLLAAEGLYGWLPCTRAARLINVNGTISDKMAKDISYKVDLYEEDEV